LKVKHDGDVAVDKIVKRASTNSDSLLEEHKMIEVGRLCVKLAGRDAGKKCVIVEVLDDKFVMVDGETRRRKCNVKHIEPTGEMMDIKKGASHADVAAEFKKLGIDLVETKPRKAKPKPTQIRAAERKKMAPKVPKKKEAPKKDEKAAAPEGDASKAEPEETALEKAAGGTEEKKE